MVCAAHDALADVLTALVEMAPAMCSAAPLPPAVAAKASGGCGGQLRARAGMGLLLVGVDFTRGRGGKLDNPVVRKGDNACTCCCALVMCCALIMCCCGGRRVGARKGRQPNAVWGSGGSAALAATTSTLCFLRGLDRSVASGRPLDVAAGRPRGSASHARCLLAPFSVSNWHSPLSTGRGAAVLRFRLATAA